MTRETLLIATRDEESEPAVVEVDERVARIRLDDGGFLAFDLTELRAAIGAETPRRT